ncbi:PD40 domain-containing protein [Crateriforma conspicua]|uniref:Protein TolB n=1 Tax=Crateriforma conspicua TaxID=2527996 RepID=A0A5C6FSA0_9PLAN|nr:PD40 domain-containing protein [Crateriforma conspicua]TWU65104.1 Protein TolB [Crateriforma conspicua]
MPTVKFCCAIGILFCSFRFLEAASLEQDPLPGNVAEIVFAERSLNYDGHWYANFGYYADDRDRKAYGDLGRLAKLDVATGKVTILLDDPKGAVRDPVVHYDGQTIVFSYRPGDTDYYHLYEIQADGTGLRQLTDGPFDDIEPTWMPDDSLVFVSTRAKRWVNCWLTHVAVLYACDRNGQNIRQLSANIEHDNTPWPLNDGRILYQRWEYIDRSQVDYHHLWTMNPDGSGAMVFYGNQSPSTLMIDAKPIPGTDNVVSIFSPGHGRKEHAGAVYVVSPKRGPDQESSAIRITPEKDFNYRDPYPITRDLILCARTNKLLWIRSDGQKGELYQVDAERAEQSVWVHEPRPLVPRQREPVIPSRVDASQATGRMFLSDVNQGRRMKVGGKPITRLLVVESLPKPINYTGGMEPISYGGTFTLERLLGTVPVEADGSAFFEVPALRSLFFIAVDEDGDTVKRMQSFTNVMPGETTGCVGCHEHRTQSPDMIDTTQDYLAIGRPPSQIQPIKGVPDVFDFPRDIQPILDRHCVTCHCTERRDGGVILTGDHGPVYSHSYYMLTYLKQFVDGRNEAKSNLSPYSIGAVVSPLMQKLSGEHHGVMATESERKIVKYWIETGAPYPGTYAALASGMIGGYQENKQVHHTGREWPETVLAASAIRRRCVSCHEKIPKDLSDNSQISFWRPTWDEPNLGRTRHIVFNLTHPEKSLVLRAPLAKDAGGDGRCGDKPVFRSKDDPDYQAILSMIRAGHQDLQKRKRFDMPGFEPTWPYVREMKRFGVLPAEFQFGRDAIDVYETDRAYWESLWYHPVDHEVTVP